MSTTVVRPGLFPTLHSSAYLTGPYQPRRQAAPPSSLRKLQDDSLEATFLSGGLRTPPAEDSTMSTTYQNPSYSSTYENHVALARQPGSLATAVRSGSILSEASVDQYPRAQTLQSAHYHQQQQYQLPSTQTSSTVVPSASAAVNAVHSSSRQSTRPSTPSSTRTTNSHHEGTVSRRESTMVMHSLVLPSCISPNGGSLDDFAALMTCFIWFESMDTILAAEHFSDRRPSEPIPKLSKYTEPCASYKKWVTSILSTTQVTQNVILLALLFVYRLKKTNPKVNGSPGSEYRLLTVALMLGNKFLDDNTYTNKTWAEVSGLSVKEIHVMEVEFLSNMRYGLLTSKDQWHEWLAKLANFYQYTEKAMRDERDRRHLANMSLNNLSSPTRPRFASPLPSPTSMIPSSMSTTSPSVSTYLPSPVAVNGAQNWNAAYQPTPTLSPLASKPSLGLPLNRKRSMEASEIVEPAPKRVPRPSVAASNLASMGSRAPTESVRLPIPQLTLDTSQASGAPPTFATTFATQASVSLPPLGPGVRAMATVYPTAAAATTTWAPQHSILATSGPQTPAYPAQSAYGTPTKRQSPTGLGAYSSSPMADPYGPHALTPISNSPSVYLQQRNSPYKPVRRVNTLLYPPPSMPLSEYHLGSAQMHYQPIGRRNDLRTGIVPEFLPGYQNRYQQQPF